MRIKIKKQCVFPGCQIFVDAKKQRCKDHPSKNAKWQKNYRKRQKLKKT